MRSLFCVATFFLLAAFTSYKGSPSKIHFDYTEIKKGRALKFNFYDNIHMEKTSKRAPRKAQFYQPSKKFGEFLSEDTKLVRTSRGKNLLLTFWSRGQVGVVRVFDPIKQKEPLCTLPSEYESMDHRFKNGTLQIKTFKKNKPRWKTCYKVY